MFTLSQDLNYYLYSSPTDMRKGFNGLCGIIRTSMGKDSLSGDVFIFVNKSRNKMKLLRWEFGGLVLYYKRLEQGTFRLPTSASGESVSIRWRDLVLLVEGINIQKFSTQNRFSFLK